MKFSAWKSEKHVFLFLRSPAPKCSNVRFEKTGLSWVAVLNIISLRPLPRDPKCNPRPDFSQIYMFSRSLFDRTWDLQTSSWPQQSQNHVCYIGSSCRSLCHTSQTPRDTLRRGLKKCPKSDISVISSQKIMTRVKEKLFLGTFWALFGPVPELQSPEPLSDLSRVSVYHWL